MVPSDELFNPRTSALSPIRRSHERERSSCGRSLAEDFTDLRGRRLRPDGRPELPLQHAKGIFHIRPLVIMRQKVFTPELEVMEHLFPYVAAVPGDGASLKGDERGSAQRLHGFHVVPAEIALVGGNLGHVESLDFGLPLR